MSTYRNYGVFKINTNTNKITTLYCGIEHIEEADLLAQYAIYHKRDHEVIYISPGWNREIQNNLDEFGKALQLAEKYKYE